MKNLAFSLAVITYLREPKKLKRFAGHNRTRQNSFESTSQSLTGIFDSTPSLSSRLITPWWSRSGRGRGVKLPSAFGLFADWKGWRKFYKNIKIIKEEKKEDVILYIYIYLKECVSKSDDPPGQRWSLLLCWIASSLVTAVGRGRGQ